MMELNNIFRLIKKQMYVCYLLVDTGTSRTYIGSTNNFEKRLRQHNREIKGGAIYTTKYGTDWRPIAIVEGFKDRSDVLKFEWSAKRDKNRKTILCGQEQRLKRLEELVKENEDRLNFQYKYKPN